MFKPSSRLMITHPLHLYVDVWTTTRNNYGNTPIVFSIKPGYWYGTMDEEENNVKLLNYVQAIKE